MNRAVTRAVTAARSSRRPRSLPCLLALAALVAGVLIGVGSSPALAEQGSSIKIPANFVYIGSSSTGRCLWGVGVEFPTVPGATSYSIDYFDGYYGHEYDTGATAPVAKQAGMTPGMNYLGITGGGGPAPCVSDVTQGGRFTKPVKAWANFPGKAPETGAIEGMIANSDGNPVQGALVTAYGPTHATAVSGPGGIYYMTVDAGNYRVIPDDPSVKKSAFSPTDISVGVPKQGSATANFKLDSGMQLVMDLSATTVPATGFAIVKGTITTTQYGKPDPGVTVQLSVDPTNPPAALLSDPKVALCGTTGRIWPAGTIDDLSGKPVDIVTDADGSYQFSLTVGTVPGSWPLDAWAENADGSLSSDVSNASDTKTLTVTPVTPKTALSSFITELDSMKSTSIAAQLSSSAGSLAGLLSSLAAKGLTNGFQFSGLTFSVGAAPDGTNVVIAPAGSPFKIGADGGLLRSSSLLDDLIIDPQEWTGHGLPSTITQAASLQYVMQNGLLSDVPTVGQWEGGNSGLKGWSLKPNKLSDSQNNLEWFGWAYAPPSGSAPGYCS